MFQLNQQLHNKLIKLNQFNQKSKEKSIQSQSKMSLTFHWMSFQRNLHLLSRMLRKLKNQTIPLTSLKSTVRTMFQSLTKLPNQLHLMVLNTFQFTLLLLKKLVNWNQSLQQKKERLIHSKLVQSPTSQSVSFLKNSKKCSLPREQSLLWRTQ